MSSFFSEGRGLFRTCIHSRMMQAGQGIFPPCKAKIRSNTWCIARFFPGAKSRLRRLRLDAPAGAATQQGGKRPDLTASDGCEYRFLQGNKGAHERSHCLCVVPQAVQRPPPGGGEIYQQDKGGQRGIFHHSNSANSSSRDMERSPSPSPVMRSIRADFFSWSFRIFSSMVSWAMSLYTCTWDC